MSDPPPAPRSATWSKLAWPAGVVGAVVLANLLAVLGIVDVSPLGQTGALTLTSHGGFLPGQWFTDPNTGWTAQSLGHLAAEDWLHGIVPWWNPFEGLGAPLAAEMQAAAFFPPTLLLALPQGQLLFHMTLESAAGLSTWFLLRELGFGRPVATLGGILFALDGTLAWFGNAPANPVAFLPLVILGIERIWRRGGSSHSGWLILAGGLALSIYSGFPETAYLDCLFALAWFVFRLFGRPLGGRWRFAARTGFGAGVGLLLAAPLALPFAGYLPLADLATNGGGAGSAHLGAAQVPSLGLPYLYGPIGAFDTADRTGNLAHYFGGTGGYLTAALVAMALVGLFAGRRERGLRILLAASAAVMLLWAFGVPPVQPVLSRVLPMARDVLAFRYLAPSWELAFVLLACFGVDAVAHRSAGVGRATLAAGLTVLALIGAELALAWHTMSGVGHAEGSYLPYPVLSVAWALLLLAGVTAAGVLAGRSRGRPGAAAAGGRPPQAVDVTEMPPTAARSPHRRAAGRAAGRRAACVVAGILALDALAMFVVPELSAPRAVTVDTGLTSYLSAHLGDGRFFSLWVLHPDYGAYFGLASADSDDLPVPKEWASYVADNLASNADPTLFDGLRVRNSLGPSATEELLDQLSAYEAIDVRYVVARTGSNPFGTRAPLVGGVKPVYVDRLVTVYALPSARPFFSTTGAPCNLVPHGLGEVVASCAAPATLVRSELDLPGWSASVNGRPATVTAAGGALTSVRLPAGTSRVTFSYVPPQAEAGLVLFGIGILAAAGFPAAQWAARRRRLGRLRADLAAGELLPAGNQPDRSAEELSRPGGGPGVPVR